MDRFISLMIVLMTGLLIASGCAGDSDLDNNGGGHGDGDGDQELDAGPTDTGADDTGLVDTGPDVEEDAGPCPVCCAGETRCSGSNTLEVCREDGSGYDGTSCDVGYICEDGACQQEPICTPGDRECHSSSQVNVCRPDGMGYVSETCTSGTICIGDECVSGAAHGSSCEEPEECAGGYCRCGSDESCALQHQGYCTLDCSSATCSGDQVCWKSNGVEAAGYDHCLRSCDTVCSLEGLSCTKVPTEVDGDPSWKGACLPPEIRGVGRLCESDDECVNGECRLDYYSNFGYCSHRCEDTGCPDDAPCVNLEGNGEFWCTPRCTSGGTHCPLVEDQIFDGSCNTRIAHGGGTAIVCTK